MFSSSYTTIYFFVKKFIFFECLYFSEYNIRISLYVFCLRKGPSVKYVRNWWGGMERVIQNAYNCVQEGGGCHVSCVRTHLHYLVSCFLQQFCLIVSCLISRNLTLPLFKKEMFVRNGYFSLASQFLLS